MDEIRTMAPSACADLVDFWLTEAFPTPESRVPAFVERLGWTQDPELPEIFATGSGLSDSEALVTCVAGYLDEVTFKVSDWFREPTAEQSEQIERHWKAVVAEVTSRRGRPELELLSNGLLAWWMYRGAEAQVLYSRKSATLSILSPVNAGLLQ